MNVTIQYTHVAFMTFSNQTMCQNYPIAHAISWLSFLHYSTDKHHHYTFP